MILLKSRKSQNYTVSTAELPKMPFLKSRRILLTSFGSECSWGLLGYILARGIDVWRRGASMHDCGNGNVKLPQCATSSLTR